MPMPFAQWRASLLPASFAGAGFKVEAGGFAGGRRLAVHEYAHGEVPYVEDLGRKGRRWQLTGYCIGPDYLDARDALIAACEAPGPATFVHPSFGTQQVHCDVCNPVEVREKGGYVAFELVFIEAGQNPGTSATADTQAQAASAASASNDATAETLNSNLGQGGVGSDAVATAQAGANYTPVTTPMASPNDSFGGPSTPLTYPGGVGGIGSA